ncbi:MAG: YoaK family protein [Caulobacter sp.]|nr:YoaK family protein [Caulobacter sp.]
MHRYSRPLRVVAILLSSLAGFVDALAFLKLGGFFVSFMSGNSTRLAVGLAEHSQAAWIAGGLIAIFVLGVILGSTLGRRAGRTRKPAVLGLVTLFLVAAALVHDLAGDPWALASSGFLALAMGALNATFERDGDIAIGITYMTGALVKFGQRLSTALSGGDRWAWAPFLLLWTGLVSGAWLGAIAFDQLGFDAIWIGASLGGVLTLATLIISRRNQPPQSTATV